MTHRKREAIDDLITRGATEVAMEVASEADRFVPMLADFIARTNGSRPTDPT